jgi:hypothetical protein
MAGDWLKMRLDLADDPAVISIALSCGIEEDTVVGKLHRLWSWADRHTLDGIGRGINSKWIDKYVGQSGFADSMKAAGWLVIGDDFIQFPDFSKHNGVTAKRRAENTLRQRLSREERDNGVTGVARDIIPKPFRRVVFVRDNYTCVYCGSFPKAKTETGARKHFSIDHLIPATRGGATVVENLATCCKSCNMEKADRTPEEWGLLPEFLQDGVTYQDGKLIGGCDKCATKARQKRDKSITASSLLFSSLLEKGKIPEVLREESFGTSWDRWVQHRHEKKADLHDTMADAQLKMLASKGLASAVSMIEHTITMGWQGLRDPEPKPSNGKPQPSNYKLPFDVEEPTT